MPRASKQEILEQQYGFLKSSIDRFMGGHESEALRIATAIRVLVHETASSTPLLKQLNPNYLQMEILDCPPEPPTPGAIRLQYIGVGFSVNSETGIRPIIDLANAPPVQRLVSLGEWWNQVTLIFTDAGRTFTFTRKQLVLTLANREGGAHVDTKLPAGYEKFVIDSPLKFMMNGVATDTVHLARFAAVQSAAQMNECLERNFPGVVK